MFHIGVDLAWGRRQPTGVAVLDDEGRLVQLAAVKVERRTYYMLGHWMLFFLCAALMVWGAFSF